MEAIAIIAPDVCALETAKTVTRDYPGRFILTSGLRETGVAEAIRVAQQGVDLVISRGETARMIAAVIPNLTVVSIQRSGLDIARAVTRARQRGKHLAAISFPDTLERITALCRALDLAVPGYAVSAHPVDETEMDTVVAQAAREGADVIVGTASILAAAQRNAIPCELVESGKESILRAIEEALSIWHARQSDRIRMSLLDAVLDATGEGIVAIDSAGNVTVCNAVAARYAGCKPGEAIGRALNSIWPELDAGRILESGETDPYMLKTSDKNLLCSVTSVKVDSKTCGAVCVLHDASRIQTLEASVRRRFYASGHVAAIRFQDIQGNSPILLQTIDIAKDYARSDATVLLMGETGTGKELFAQGIHNSSARARGPFVAVNCAALPGQLLESELFGYVAGAFTGASTKGKTGLFELAHGGTIFLDEVTEMDLAVQAKLLRVLQEKKIRRVGSEQIIPIDVRVIASTNRDIRQLAAGNGLRTDLYYRLNVLQLRLPPLRERRDDIPLLCRHFLSQSNPALAINPKAMRLLQSYCWPGNVRELQNIMDRIAVTLKASPVTEKNVKLLLGNPGDSFSISPDRVEAIHQALREAGGHRGKAAVRLGVSRSTLWRAMRRMGL